MEGASVSLEAARAILALKATLARMLLLRTLLVTRALPAKKASCARTAYVSTLMSVKILGPAHSVPCVSMKLHSTRVDRAMVNTARTAGNASGTPPAIPSPAFVLRARIASLHLCVRTAGSLPYMGLSTLATALELALQALLAKESSF
jgi:hypothetical protein